MRIGITCYPTYGGSGIVATELGLELARRGHDVHFITTLHGTDITLVGTDRSYFPITKFSIERSDGVTTISEYMRQRTVDFFGITKPIEVIHNFVNCDLYKPDDQARS